MLACMASASILLSGGIVGAYFVQLRGPGWEALLAGEWLPELVLVAGVVAALAVVVHLQVLRALAATRGPASVRGMLRRALDLLGAADGEASEAYAALPAEVRELVGLFESQRTREQQGEREKQRLRQEMTDFLGALERSRSTMEPLRVEGAGELAGRVAPVWNQLLVQARQAAAALNAPMPAAMPASAVPMPASAVPMPAMAQAHAAVPTGEAAAFAAARAAEAQANMSRRMQELEARLSTLQEELRTLHARDAAAAAVEPVSLFVPERPAAMPPTVAAEGPGAPLSALPEPTFLEPEEVFEGSDAADGPTWTDVSPTAVPWTGVAPAKSTFDLSAPEPEIYAEAAPEPEICAEATAGPEEELRFARSEVLQPLHPTKASDSGYIEWTGASQQAGSWKLRDEAREVLSGTTGADPESAPQAAAAPERTLSAAETAAAQGPANPSFDHYFPHFVGKPVGDLEGRVAVSFEGTATPAARTPRPATLGFDIAREGSEPSTLGARRPWDRTEFDT